VVHIPVVHIPVVHIPVVHIRAEQVWTAYSPARGADTCCHPFRNPRTSVSLYRR
jgi:hypothetical protein